MKPIIYFFFIAFIFTSCNKSSTLFEKLPNSVTDINFRNDLILQYAIMDINTIAPRVNFLQ